VASARPPPEDTTVLLRDTSAVKFFVDRQPLPDTSPAGLSQSLTAPLEVAAATQVIAVTIPSAIAIEDHMFRPMGRAVSMVPVTVHWDG
jgi:hypothetical protein